MRLCSCITEEKKKIKFWVHPLISGRLTDGQFYKLFDNLKKYPTNFLNYFRMSEESFEKLLALVRPRITHQDTHLRLAVGPEERLAVTLRYLETGNCFASLHFEFTRRFNNKENC